MNEEEVIERLNKILEEWQEIINIEDETEREINMSMYFEEMPFKEIQTVLQLLEQKDKRIDDLEKALLWCIDMEKKYDWGDSSDE